MKKFIAMFASAAVLTTATFNMSLAQTSDKAPADQPQQAQTPAAQPDRATADHAATERKGPPDNQIADDADARIAKLKAELRLTPDQEKNWGGLQTSLREYEIAQVNRLTAGRSAHEDRHDDDRHARDDRPDDIAMMRSEADRLTASGGALKKLADAAEPMYGSLDDRQKHKLVQYLKSDFEMQRR